MSDDVALFEGLIDALLDPEDRKRKAPQRRARRGAQPQSDTIHAPKSSSGGGRRRRRRRRGGEQDGDHDSQARPASE